MKYDFCISNTITRNLEVISSFHNRKILKVEK